MLRAEHCICGTASTGTGTLVLAACPTPPGGTDPFQAFNAQGLGTAVPIPISYTIVEYTDTTFRTASRQEKGVGSLTLGSPTTLARTTVQQTATSMDTTPTYNTAEPTAISISAAANTLIFIAASAADLLVCSPYFDRTLPSTDAIGALPVNVGGTFTGSLLITTMTDYYNLFEWRTPMLVKRVRVNVATTYSGAFNTSQMYGRLYAVGANARPTKLLYDFGSFAGSPLLGSTGIKATTVSGSGFYLQPGEYFLDIMPRISGGAGTPSLSIFPQAYNSGRLGYGTGIGVGVAIKATSGSTLAGDPANVTGLDLYSPNQLFFGLSTT
jgi:hypothetical protein